MFTGEFAFSLDADRLFPSFGSSLVDFVREVEKRNESTDDSSSTNILEGIEQINHEESKANTLE